MNNQTEPLCTNLLWLALAVCVLVVLIFVRVAG